MAGNSSQAGRSVTSKITAILLAFSAGSEHSLTTMAARARVPISTAHRLATELVTAELLQRTPEGHYRTGPLLQQIKTSHPGQPDIFERAPYIVDDLCEAAQCRVRLGVLTGPDVAYIENRPATHKPSTLHVAATLPAHPTALGRALLAYAPAATVELTLQRGLQAYTPHTITSPTQFRRALEVIRQHQIALTQGEFEAHLQSVATPVVDSTGHVVAAVELAAPHLDLPHLLPMLTVACRRLSHEISAVTQATHRPGRGGGVPDEPGQTDAPLAPARDKVVRDHGSSAGQRPTGSPFGGQLRDGCAADR